MRRLLSVCLFAAVVLSAAAADVVYRRTTTPQFITTANTRESANNMADLDACFSAQGEALFDTLYVMGKQWKEVAYYDYAKALHTTALMNAYKQAPPENIFVDSKYTIKGYWALIGKDTVGVLVALINDLAVDQHETVVREPWIYEFNDDHDTIRVPGGIGTGYNQMGAYVKDSTQDYLFFTDEVSYVYTVFEYKPGDFRYGGKDTAYQANPEKYTHHFKYYAQRTDSPTHANVISWYAALWNFNHDNQTSEELYRIPCYVYGREADGKSYGFVRAFDATSVGLGTITAPGKKIYLNGRTGGVNTGEPNYREANKALSAALCGNGGFLNINAKGTTDVYLENVVLTPKSQWGESENDEPTSPLKRSVRQILSAPIIVEGDGTKVNIHIRGRNLLRGGWGGKFTVAGMAQAYLPGAAIFLNTAEKEAITLTLDDLWDGQHSNGFLQLEGCVDNALEVFLPTHPDESQRGIAPISSGNNRCTINFNGGQYRFVQSDQTGSHENFMTIARREYTIERIVLGMTVRGTAYDIGHDIGDANVNIYDGVFTTYPEFTHLIPAQKSNGDVENGQHVLYFPTNTRISGGKFVDCLVRTIPDALAEPTCPVNDAGEPLFDKEVDNTDYPDSRVCIYEPNANMECGVVQFYQNWDVGFCSGLNEYIFNEDRLLYAHTKTDHDYVGTHYLGMLEVNPVYPSRHKSKKSHITEPDDYHITSGVVLLTYVMSNQWRVFTMPVNVDSVCMLLTCANNANDEFDYYVRVVEGISLNGNWTDLVHTRGGMVDFMSLYKKQIPRNIGRDFFDPSNPADKHAAIAHLNLNDIDHDLYRFIDGGWRPATTFEAGGTYALRLNDPDGNAYDGKYLAFIGGGQDISGTNSQTFPNTEGIYGNITFNTVSLPRNQVVFVWDDEQQAFVRDDGVKLDWLQSYLIADDATTDNSSSLPFDMVFQLYSGVDNISRTSGLPVGIYTLTGQRLDAVPQTPGMYIEVTSEHVRKVLCR